MIRILIFTCAALGLTLIALLSRASSNSAFMAEYYPWLFGLSLALATGLLTLVGYQILSLRTKLRNRIFGSKLTLRLMAVFALMAIVPGVMVYGISVQFLSRSIDSWFDVPVDRALEGALNLGKSALDAALSDLVRKAQNLSQRITERPEEETDILKQQISQNNIKEITLLNKEGKALSASGAYLFSERTNAQELRDALQGRAVKALETQSDRAAYLRVLVAVLPGVSGGETRIMQLVQAVPKPLAADLQSVESGIRDYQQLGLQRPGLKKLFALTLTLTMLLTLFSAISLAFLLSERLSAPLSALAESTRAIARGDFSKLNPVKSRDEFGVLTQSFNTMTRQLAEASDIVARKQKELENANTYLESILGHLTSGVLTLDTHLQLKTINPNAAEMLHIDPQHVGDHQFIEWGTLVPALKPFIDDIGAQIITAKDKPWERQITFDSPQGRRILLVHGTKLPATINHGFVLVFDDITDLIQVQRSAAWGEVARRLAHEIKNPLTPIQLSAERLQMKLADKLPETEQAILTRATHTIVAQVGALKQMVDDFSLYSRSATLRPVPLAPNELIRDVLTLYEPMNITITPQLAEPMPTITADPALLRQVLHNILQNALDALNNVEHPCIHISTTADETYIYWHITDNGSGISETVMAHIFEPYVTTKPKGTGLGLAIVKKIIDEHHGTISFSPAKPQGTGISITLPITYTPTHANEAA
ncbi:MAG: HAMP domain-containing protein [Betaproteobacteria bacterium]|nr:HAMP domain-containing protein [Betaproteobacteria bacterium]